LPTSSASRAVEGAEAIFVVVADAPAAQFVLDQIESKLGLCQLIIRSSTIFSQMDFAVRQTGAENRSAVFGAPFTGSKLAANRRSSLEGSLLDDSKAWH
jgi:3-hydroxyisobutyrate dehydrogenase-like beta-hydroxyacid dehydrogenase